VVILQHIRAVKFGARLCLRAASCGDRSITGGSPCTQMTPCVTLPNEPPQECLCKHLEQEKGVIQKILIDRNVTLKDVKS
jgi:hypothetical protein